MFLSVWIVGLTVARAEPAWVSIAGVMASPQASTAMEDADVGLQRTLETLATARGLRVTPWPEIFFGRDLPSPTVQIGGYIRKATCRSEEEFHCEVKVRWEISDVRARMVVRADTRTATEASANRIEAMQRAVATTLGLALQNPEFVSAIPANDRLPPVAFDEPYRIPPCKSGATSLPRDLSPALDAVVYIHTRKGSGSGVLVSPAGVVATAAHVVGNERDVEVVLRSGLSLDGRVVRLDEAYDVALVAVPGKGYACRPWASAAAAVGQEVHVVGAPLGADLGWSVTRGIISANREIHGRTLLQTDASINAGNSGGPLFSPQGEVVALAGSKLVGVGIEGLSFGIPISDWLLRLAVSSSTTVPYPEPGGKAAHAWVFKDVTPESQGADNDGEKKP